jgi:hypothetical protein
MRLVIGCLVLSSSVAFADEQPQPNLTVGLGAEILKVFSTSGGVGNIKASDQGTAYGVDLYAEYRFSTHFSIGLAIPMTFNGPGPTSNEYDFGIALRLRGDYPATPWLRPFVVIEPRLALSRLPESEFWTGKGIAIDGGARLDITAASSIVGWIGLVFTSFSGDVTDPDTQMKAHGSVQTAYFSAGAGLELRF